jgi:hypothetical protein
VARADHHAPRRLLHLVRRPPVRHCHPARLLLRQGRAGHSLTYLLTYLLTCSLAHLLAYSLAYLLTYLRTCSLYLLLRHGCPSFSHRTPTPRPPPSMGPLTGPPPLLLPVASLLISSHSLQHTPQHTPHHTPHHTPTTRSLPQNIYEAKVKVAEDHARNSQAGVGASRASNPSRAPNPKRQHCLLPLAMLSCLL